MRHIGTLIAAAVIGPLAWILLAFGQDRSAQAFANAHSNGAYHTGDFLRPVLFLGAAGILLGLIATLRFSPLGAVLTGAVYSASYAVLLVAPNGLMGLFKHSLSIAGRQADPATPIRTGTTMVLGAVLLVAVASVRRWQRWPRPAAADQTDPATEEPEHRVGVDGLGLTPRSAEPTEAESRARYLTGAERVPAGGADSHWAASLHSGSGSGSGSEDPWR
jgi:hypothetical protein